MRGNTHRGSNPLASARTKETTREMDTKQVIAVRKDLNMRKGKLAAQVAHASMAFITRKMMGNVGGNGIYEVSVSRAENEWLASSFAKIVVSVNSEEELQDLIAKAREAGILVHEIVDNGRTEFRGVPTLTCAAFGPDLVERLDPITSHLPLI